MVKLAIEDNSAFELSELELNRPGPHYTSDTIKLLAEQNPQAEIVPIIGGDSLNDLPTWHEPKEIIYAAHWVGVMRRPGEETNLQALEQELPGISSKIHYVEAPLLEIASSEIRSRIAKGKPFRYYLPELVYEYIEKHHLYQPAHVINQET
jgi:nicotinate-nucleotide adenylyltransferase